jgi:hypothetical protein
MKCSAPVIVTGCQRSGTMLTAQIIAHECDCYFMEEFDFLPQNHGLSKLALLCLEGKGDVVVQAPFALGAYEEIYNRIPGVCFVGVKRNKKDILKSLKRIKWCQESSDEWGDISTWNKFLTNHVDKMGALWEQLKKDLPSDNWVEFKYEDLQQHPFFVSPELRKNFSVKQWRIGEPCGLNTWSNNQKCIEDKIGKALINA